MSASPAHTVLITGCSTGIGRATALHLAAAGHRVHATARRPESIADLADHGCRTWPLDVTDEESMQAAVRAVEAEGGSVDVLVNNAGYSRSGAVESIPPEDLRAQFETNVFGLVRMCQLVLPGMREQGWGRIINISSMGANFTFPGGGAYHASKYAVEALSDALRFEVAGFGVGVTLLQPGLIRTEFAATASTAATSGQDEGGDAPAADPGAGAVYAEFNRRVAAATREAYERGPLARLGGGPESVAKAVEKAIDAERAPIRVPVTASARLMTAQRRLLGDRGWERFLGTQFSRPGRDG